MKVLSMTWGRFQIRSGRASSLALTSSLAAALALSGCAKDPSKEVPAAKVEPTAAAEPAAEAPKAEAPAEVPVAPAAAAAPAAAEPAAAPAVEPAAAAAAPAAAPGGIALSGSIVFIGSKVTGSHDCKFTEWSGSARLVDGKAEGGSLSFEVKTASVVADYKQPNDWSKKLEGHLKDADFFDVAKFPTATFESKTIALATAGEPGATHIVIGKLTIRGVTKDVTFPATIKVEGGKVSAQAKFSINRKDFGIEYTGKADDLIRDGVVLEIDLQG